MMKVDGKNNDHECGQDSHPSGHHTQTDNFRVGKTMRVNSLSGKPVAVLLKV